MKCPKESSTALPQEQAGGDRTDAKHPREWEFDEEFDGGDETCGRVIINLYTYLLPMPPGTRVMLISKDPAAPIEFPAWCRMTRNTLLDMRHPYYLIEYKPELKKE